MSRTDTWMPLYIGDYLADTGRLTTQGHGAYLLILMDYWRNGAPPDDDDVLCGIARVERKAWDRDLKKIIRSFFTVGEDGCLHQKRLDKERAHAIDLSSKRRSAAMKKGQSEAKVASASDPDDGSNCSAIAPAIAEQEHDLLVTHARVAIPSPSQLPKERKNPQQPTAASPPKPQRGCRLPAGWEANEAGIDLAASLGLNVAAVLAQFRDYWLAQPGARALKTDWDATWRVWCRREAERAPHRSMMLPKPSPMDWAKEHARKLELELGGPIH